jgi:hypothetical protein
MLYLRRIAAWRLYVRAHREQLPSSDLVRKVYILLRSVNTRNVHGRSLTARIY